MSTLFRSNKKATPSNKIASLYLVDAISREARSCAKKAKGKEVAVPAASPREGVLTLGTYSSFLSKVEALLGRIVMDCWENGAPEHRVRRLSLGSLLGPQS